MMKLHLYRLSMVVMSTLVLSLALAQSAYAAHKKPQLSPFVDTKGNISLPQNIRGKLQHIGAWFVPDGGASGFHDVFTEAASIEYYRKHKVFPDGAVLVKELRGAHTGDYTTGNNVKYSKSEIKQWFVMIKDSKGRFSNNANWGEGWGWALFKPDTGPKNLSKDYKADCLGCHTPVKDKDWVYVEGYPTLFED